MGATTLYLMAFLAIAFSIAAMAFLVSFALASRQRCGELAIVVQERQEFQRELVHLRREYRALRLELDRMRQIDRATNTVERDCGAPLH